MDEKGVNGLKAELAQLKTMAAARRTPWSVWLRRSVFVGCLAATAAGWHVANDTWAIATAVWIGAAWVEFEFGWRNFADAVMWERVAQLGMATLRAMKAGSEQLVAENERLKEVQKRLRAAQNGKAQELSAK